MLGILDNRRNNKTIEKLRSRQRCAGHRIGIVDGADMLSTRRTAPHTHARKHALIMRAKRGQTKTQSTEAMIASMGPSDQYARSLVCVQAVAPTEWVEAARRL